MWERTIFCAVLSLPAALGADATLLERIRTRMASNLVRAPNYTCVETVERAVRQNAKQEFRTSDRLRLEVALVEGKELYSWPGAGKFEERTPGEIVPGGTTTTGEYALHAQTVFASKAPEFGAGVEEELDGRRAVRYDFRIGQLVTSYRVQVGTQGAMVPYAGSLWAEAATLELLRLVVDVEEVPEELGVKRATTQIDYGKVRVGASDFLLPRRVEFVVRRADGSESRNRTEFSRCRQYVGQTEISFEEPGEARPEDKRLVELHLPARLSVETRLETEIDSDQAAIGDPVMARVSYPVKKGGKVVVPKGAVLRGRVRRIEPGESRGPYFAVELEFSEMEWEQSRARWTARLEAAGPVAGWARNALSVPVEQTPGHALVLVWGRRVRLPQGFRLLWMTGS